MFTPLRLAGPCLVALTALAVLSPVPAQALSSYAEFAVDEIGSSTGAASVGLGVPDYAFVNDAGEGFGGINADVFEPGEATVLTFPAALRDIPGQEDLFVSAFVGGLGETDDAHVQVEVSDNGVDFTAIDDFHTADGRTTYPFDRERDFSTVKHFAVDFAGEDFVTHVRLTNLAGTAAGLRLDAVEGLHPVVGSSRAFEIRFERYRGPAVSRFLVRIKNLGSVGGAGIRGIALDSPPDDSTKLEETEHSLFGLDGEFLCVENCVGDNADPPNRQSRHEWSADGLVVAPAGVGLAPGHQAAHLRFESFDLDHLPMQQPFLAGFTFLLEFTDGSQHPFDWDTDVVGRDVTGMQYQKYLYHAADPDWSTPEEVHYFEVVPACGDGIVAEGEQCDDGNLVSGDGCDANCTITACGNDIVTSGESCDDGNLASGDGCDSNCTVTACGNGITSSPEECDDANLVSGDGCDENCTQTACGNSVITAGEQCDDGNQLAGDGCRSDCTIEACGDGVPDPQEGCDDGNNAGGDGCRSDCTVEVCGDAILDPQEECDDGNTIDQDGCSSACLIGPLCGDGLTQSPEQCDDGNDAGGDGCRADCTVEACGDGIHDPQEECDDGNLSPEDGCSPTCTFEGEPPICGDGALDLGEDCDDGNTVGGDGCREDCSEELCGDGIEDPLEECDDGNTVDDELCNGDCTIPVPEPSRVLMLLVGSLMMLGARAARARGPNHVL